MYTADIGYTVGFSLYTIQCLYVYLYGAVASIPSCDTEAGPVLTLPVQLAPEQRRGGQADGDQADAGEAAVDDEVGDAFDADLGSHSLL